MIMFKISPTLPRIISIGIDIRVSVIWAAWIVADISTTIVVDIDSIEYVSSFTRRIDGNNFQIKEVRKSFINVDHLLFSSSLSKDDVNSKEN